MVLLEKLGPNQPPWRIDLDFWEIQYTEKQTMRIQEMKKKMNAEKKHAWLVDRNVTNVGIPSITVSPPYSFVSTSFPNMYEFTPSYIYTPSNLLLSTSSNPDIIFKEGHQTNEDSVTVLNNKTSKSNVSFNV